LRTNGTWFNIRLSSKGFSDRSQHQYL